MSEHFGPRDHEEYRRDLEETEPGRRFAIALIDLQNRLGLDFSAFCNLVGVSEAELEDDLLNGRIPPAEVIGRIIKATHAKIEFLPEDQESMRLAAYIAAAMRHADYERLEDGTYYSRILATPGVWANEETLERCREVLQEVLEGWIVLSLRQGDHLPVIDGVHINPKREEEKGIRDPGGY